MGEATKPGAKPALSSKILGLKFMQRAQEKKNVVEAAEAETKRDVEAHWVVEGAKSRCVVLTEGDPLPLATDAGGSSGGRFSFGGFNPAAERVASGAAATAGPGGQDGGEDNAGAGVTVSDADMAARLAPQRQQQQQRRQRNEQHQREKQQQAQVHSGQGKRKGWQRDHDSSSGGRGSGARGGKRARYFGAS